MPEVPSVLAAWSNFYVITGSSAAALKGLMFVVVTLVAGGNRSEPTSDTNVGFGTFSTPTVVHFCVAFFVSATLSAPWRTSAPIAVLMGLTGLFGIVYMFRVISRTRRLTAYEPILEDWIWFVILPFVAYVAIAVAAILLRTDPTVGSFLLAGATTLLIFIGIHNAWDVVTYLAIDRFTKR